MPLSDLHCPECDSSLIGVEYSYGHPEHYDGISEWKCSNPNCGIRWGRWTERRLKKKEFEKRYGVLDIGKEAGKVESKKSKRKKNG